MSSGHAAPRSRTAAGWHSRRRCDRTNPRPAASRKWEHVKSGAVAVRVNWPVKAEGATMASTRFDKLARNVFASLCLAATIVW